MKTDIDFLVDTNIVIYAMEGHPALQGLLRCQPAISIVTEMELLGKKGIELQEEAKIRQLLEGFPILGLTSARKEATIKIRQSYTMRLPDAIIAATSIQLGLPLLTADIALQKIKELEVILFDPRNNKSQ